MRRVVVDLGAVNDELAREWAALAARAVDPNAYLDPRFLVPAAADGGPAHGVRVAFAEDDEGVHGAIAFGAWQPKRGVPLGRGATGIEFLNDHADRHHPLVDAVAPEAAVATLVAAVTGGTVADMIDVRAMPGTGPLADAVDALDRRGVLYVDRGAEIDAPVARPESASLPGLEGSDIIFGGILTDSAYGSKMRRNGRLIERDSGNALRVEDIGQDPGIADEFIAFQSAGWKGDPSRGGGALALNPPHEAWFRALVANFQRDGDLSAVRLVAGDETVSLTLGMRSGGAYFGLLDAFNERFGKYSPGVLGRIAAWNLQLTRTDAMFHDPGVDPSSPALARAFPDRRAFVDTRLTPHTARGAIVRRALRGR